MSLVCLETEIGAPGGPTTAPEMWALMRGVPVPAGTAPSPRPAAVVNHGRWIVRCPYCPSAEFASRTCHLFLCCECANQNNGWLQVRWPNDAALIEQTLLARPGRHNQHWEPGETVADLLAENVRYLGVAA